MFMMIDDISLCWLEFHTVDCFVFTLVFRRKICRHERLWVKCRKSENRQYNDQKNKDKKTNYTQQNNAHKPVRLTPFGYGCLLESAKSIVLQ